MFVLDETSAPRVAVEHGLLKGAATAVELLEGGYMNTVFRVRGGGDSTVVLKQALPTLRAFPEIAVLPERLRFEHAALAYLTQEPALPGGEVPRPLWFDEARNVLAMTDLGADRRRLEDALVAGDVDAETARSLGRFLVALHNRTADDPELRARFANTAMHQLRLEFCFFGFCDDPEVVPHIEALAQEFTERKQVLLHGDFWTASILVDGDLPGVYDLEFCNYGDPAQDLGFMLAHYLLHYHNTPVRAPAVRAAVGAMWSTYQSGVTYDQDPGFTRRVVQQVGVEMLFRVSGINTVAYVTDPERKAAIMTAAKRCIRDPGDGIDALWR